MRTGWKALILTGAAILVACGVVVAGPAGGRGKGRPAGQDMGFGPRAQGQARPALQAGFGRIVSPRRQVRDLPDPGIPNLARRFRLVQVPVRLERTGNDRCRDRLFLLRQVPKSPQQRALHRPRVADTGSTEGYNPLSLQVALGNVMLPAGVLWEDN